MKLTMTVERARNAFAVGAGAVAVIGGASGGCRDLSEFKTSPGDRFEGPIVQADFVRAGVSAGTTLCLTLDTDRLQDAPGAISTSDGLFHATPLRPIPQIWHDPLSTISFGEGRLQNMIYSARAEPRFPDGLGADVFAVVSLMQTGGVEVRILRGAPPSPATTGASDAAAPGPLPPIFAIFDLSRMKGPCSY
jgi:hypothetical protein